MKVTRIEVEGPVGEATITREDRKIIISGRRVTKVLERREGAGISVGETFRLVGRADNHDANVVVARMLQKHLDGHVGTNGDVAEYLRVIEAFTD